MRSNALYLLGIEAKQWLTKEDNKKAQELLTKAITLAPDAEAHLALGMALLYHDRQIEGGNNEIERALALGPNNADVNAITAWGRSSALNTAREDLALVKRAMMLNPHYPQWYLIPLSYAAYHGYQYEEAIHAAEEMATPTLESLLYVALNFSAEGHINNDVFLNGAVIKHFLDSIEKAGLPLCATEASSRNIQT
jgi:tetratricopeptide (TPR) repeat protein